jgi:hypothetical protein
MPSTASFMTSDESPYQQIIIAGSDEDVSTGDLLEWVHPVLAGIPNGRWSSCELEFHSETEVFARYRSGSSSIELNLSTGWTAEDIASFAPVIPAASALAIIMLDDHASQVLMLMDGIANWLNMFETSQTELKPIVLLFERFSQVVKSIG